MKSKWEFANSPDPGLIGEIVNRLRVPRPLARVLQNRGLVDVEEIRRFLHPETSYLHDPFLLKDMNLAVDRLILALREREEMLIFGDYDVDGITSVSLLYLFLKDLGGMVSYYIPDRSTEGYGLSPSGIEEAREHNCSLIVSVDCGITSVDEVELAKRYGLDVIISDHHEPGERLPNALAVVDPKRLDCAYPFKELAGVGVAYKLAQGISIKLGIDQTYIEKYLDLAAIGSAADIVPLIGENRIFVKLGLEKLNRDGLDGILTLIETAGFQPGQIGVGQIVYGLAPRINAVGRLGHAKPAVELLVTRNHLQASRIAHQLEEENRRRKQIDTQTLADALNKINIEFNPEKDWVIVLAGEDWHPGVIGIVASRIIERFYRPTVMITIDNGIGKGSARSIPNFDLYRALKACSDLFVQFGGHKYAAGLTIAAERIPEFKKRFNEVAQTMLSAEDLTPSIKIDDEVTLDEIKPELARMINLLGPFGSGNSCPLFVAHGLQVLQGARVVGSNHLKFKVAQNGITHDAIAFNRGEYLEFLRDSQQVDLVFNIELNQWLDRTTLQLKVKDIK